MYQAIAACFTAHRVKYLTPEQLVDVINKEANRVAKQLRRLASAAEKEAEKAARAAARAERAAAKAAEAEAAPTPRTRNKKTA